MIRRKNTFQNVEPGVRGKVLDETNIKGALAQRVRADGKRQLSLRESEKKDFKRKQLIEAAVSMFLDLEHDTSWNEMAVALGITLISLKTLTKTDEFQDCYNEHFAELGHDPRLRATQAALVDMLPQAVRELRDLLSCNAPTVKLAAIKEVIRLNGIDQPKTAASDRNELAEFLKNAGVNLTQVNVTVPPEYTQAVRDTVDATFVPLQVAVEDSDAG